jgi:hypothetical protein
MKIRLLTAASLILILASCTEYEKTDNHYYFASCFEDIPVVRFDYSDDPDSIKEKIKNSFDYDICRNGDISFFKIPIEIDGKPGFLKFQISNMFLGCDAFTGYCCFNCFIDIRMNASNNLLIEGHYVQKDSFREEIMEYFDSIGASHYKYPRSYDQMIFNIKWDSATSHKSINQVFKDIYKAHLKYIENKVKKNGLVFSELSISQLDSLKREYPLKIEIDLDNSILFAPKPVNVSDFIESEIAQP